jgi:peptide/nickel transport system permease protein
MWKYILKRLLLGAVTVALISLVVYALLYTLPGKPWSALLSRAQTLEQRQRIIEQYGVDQPFILQYWTFFKNLTKPLWTPFTGQWQPPDLGESEYQHDSVWNAINVRLGATAQLMITAYIVTLAIAIPIGIISAVKQYSKLDNVVTSLSFFGISLPNYWFGELLIFIFAIFPYQHGYHVIFPAGDRHTGLDTGIVDLGWHLVLPVMVLAVQIIAQYARFIRSSMLEVLNQDYIRTARAKGLANRRVVVRHAFRNSLLPFITLMGLDIPTLFVGAIITEFVFNWPGMGQLFVASAVTNDYAILLGILVILSSLVVLGNLIADVAYTWADPRISYESGR